MRTRSSCPTTGSIDAYIRDCVQTVSSGAKRSFNFPPTLCSSDRHLVHKMAAAAGLNHVTLNPERYSKYIRISRDSVEAPKSNYNLRTSTRTHK